MVFSLNRRSALASLAAACVPPAVWAQPAWQPAQPLRLLVSFPTGGHLDVIARLIAPPLAEALGQPVVVENRPGANGNIAGSAAAKAAPDGLTWLATSADAVAVNPFLYRADFDPVKDLVPVTQLVSLSMMVVAAPSFPATDARSLIAHLKASPRPLSYATPGVGSGPHLAAELFQREAGVRLNHVPYKGLAAAITDLLGGHVDLVFDAGVGLPQVREGKLKLVTVVGRERLPEFPGVGTLAEAGVRGFESDATFVLLAPAGTPQAAIARVNAEVARALRTETVEAQLRTRNLRAIANSPAEAARALQADVQRQGRIIREAGIKVE
ncbi:MAG: tripartite tricarboxylate transporter substrate binding protein [Burkholderiaceae bacterium]|nr:tripartite tricarboxylate transporter substrate binding protein [Burkholderiaceae bacterium]